MADEDTMKEGDTMKNQISEDEVNIDDLSPEEDDKLIEVYEKGLSFIQDADWELPECIFHYTSPGGLKGIIENSKLWFTNYRFLNDRSEKVYTYQMLKVCMEEKKDYLKKQFYDEVIKCISDEGKNIAFTYRGLSERYDYYLASFSCNKDNLNLWNYYTKNESKTGYNLAFETEKLEASLENKHFNFLRVNYDRKKQKEEIMNYIDCYNEAWDENARGVYLGVLLATFLDEIELMSIRSKHEAFKGESEVRIVYKGDSEFRKMLRDNGLIRFREMNGIMVPYLEITFAKESIAGISMSPTQRDEMAQEGLVRLLEYKGYNHIESQKITISEIPLRY